VHNQQRFVADKSCHCDLLASFIRDGAGGHLNDIGYLEFHGMTGECLLQHDVSQAANDGALVFDLDNIIVRGTFTVQQNGAGTKRALARARDAVFETSVVVAGLRSDLDILGASFSQAALASAGVPAGRIDRSIHRDVIILDDVLAVPYVFSVPYIHGDYTVVYELNAAIATDVITTLKSADGFTATSTADDGSATFAALMNYP
jgi:hypothetical protein